MVPGGKFTDFETRRPLLSYDAHHKFIAQLFGLTAVKENITVVNCELCFLVYTTWKIEKRPYDSCAVQVT